MKKLISLFSVTALALGAFAFSSCNPLDGLDDVLPDYDTEWKDNGNTATWTVEASYAGVSYKAVITFIFDDDNVCTDATMKETFPTTEEAQASWESLTEDERASGSISGKTVTYKDETFVGLTKAQIKMAVESADDYDDLF